MQYRFVAKVGNSIYYPKGFYYQGKFVILVGCVNLGHSIRKKYPIKDVDITVINKY